MRELRVIISPLSFSRGRINATSRKSYPVNLYIVNTALPRYLVDNGKQVASK